MTPALDPTGPVGPRPWCSGWGATERACGRIARRQSGRSARNHVGHGLRRDNDAPRELRRLRTVITPVTRSVSRPSSACR